jgi:hypothetical protein
MIHEDDEDDDSDSGVEDDPLGIDPEEDCCSAGDDGCGPLLSHGQVVWGAGDDAQDRLPKPIYGVDQSKGAINEQEAHRAYVRTQREPGQ